MTDKDDKDREPADEEYYKPPSAMTLSQRKSQPTGNTGGSNPRDPRNRAGPKKPAAPVFSHVVEFSEAWVQVKVREEIGFDQHNPYKDEADEVELVRMTEVAREEAIADRVEKAKTAEFKYIMQAKTHLEREKLAARTPVPVASSQGRKRARKDPRARSESEDSRRGGSRSDSRSYSDSRSSYDSRGRSYSSGSYDSRDSRSYGSGSSRSYSSGSEPGYKEDKGR